MDAGTRAERAAADWLARRDGEGWQAADEAALEAWLGAEPAHRVAFLRLQAAWDETVRLKALRPPLPAADWAAAAPLRVRAPAPRRRRWRLPAAAAAAALLALAVGVFGDRWRGPVEEADFRSGLGRIETVALSDGSRATLGTDSHISVRLDRAERRIALARGEGFFEVAKAPDRPFVVAAGSHEVIAVGTAFSVRRQDDGIRIVVTEGTVRLVAAGSDPGEGLLLPAGSVATTGGGGVLVRSQPLAEVARLVDWRNGFLVFQDSALAAAADEFNRYNARRLEIGDAAAGALRIGGSFRWDQLDSFVGLLEAGFPVCAARAPERIVLYTAGDPHCR